MSEDSKPSNPPNSAPLLKEFVVLLEKLQQNTQLNTLLTSSPRGSRQSDAGSLKSTVLPGGPKPATVQPATGSSASQHLNNITNMYASHGTSQAAQAPVPAAPHGQRMLDGKYTGPPVNIATSDTLAARDSAATYYSNNPVYGQDDAASPVVRSRQYTPSLAPALEDQRDTTVPAPHVPAAAILFTEAAQVPYYQGHMVRYGLVEPAWNADRLALTGKDIEARADMQISAARGSQVNDLSTLPPDVQERTVLHSLLNVFLGLDSEYIHPTWVPAGPGSAQKTLVFSFHGSIPKGSLYGTVQNLLPIGEYVVVIRKYIETHWGYKAGMVSQALAGAMQAYLDEWTVRVSQLDDLLRRDQLTVQMVVYHCQEPQAGLKLLACIAADAAARRATSAGVLNLLHAKAASLVGDPSGHALVDKMLHAACRPYFEILDKWLAEGVLDDSYGEFMVQENQDIKKEEMTADRLPAYWYTRYIIRQMPPEACRASSTRAPAKDVPVLLEQVADVILTTGKYLNAIRACGKEISRPWTRHTPICYDKQQSFFAAVRTAHTHASAALLAVLHDYQLLPVMRSIKHYFFLDQGDFLLDIVEAVSEELDKPMAQLIKPRLQSLVELAVRTSSLASDPHCNNLKASDVDVRGLTEMSMQLHAPRSQSASSSSGTPRSAAQTGWDVLMFSYKLTWPLILVIPEQQMSYYQLIFKLIFSLRRVERHVVKTWQRMQRASLGGRADHKELKMATSLVHRQTVFVQEFLRYITGDVLEPLWLELEEGIKKAADIDEVIDKHRQFLQRAAAGLLLAKPEALECIVSLQQLALSFCERVNVTLCVPLETQAAARQLQGRRGAPRTTGGSSAGNNTQVKVEVPAELAQIYDSFSQHVSQLMQLFKDWNTELVSRTGENQVSVERAELQSLENLIARLELQVVQ